MRDPQPRSRQVTAHNDAKDSGNPMHDDAFARSMNFKGALVPGVTVFGYMTHSLIEQFGPHWLRTGCMRVRFRRPVYAGETLDVVHRIRAGEHDEQIVDIEVRNPKDEVCVIGCAAPSSLRAVVPSLSHGPLAAYRDLPVPAWPAEREHFAAQRLLGTLEARFNGTEAAGFLLAMQDDHEIYQGGVTHPAWLLRQANLVVDRNFDLGPWIHVESELECHGLARNDERIEVRAQVSDLFERKGHEYFDLDVALLADGDPSRLIMRVMHRAIYKIARSP